MLVDIPLISTYKHDKLFSNIRICSHHPLEWTVPTLQEFKYSFGSLYDECKNPVMPILDVLMQKMDCLPKCAVTDSVFQPEKGAKCPCDLLGNFRISNEAVLTKLQKP